MGPVVAPWLGFGPYLWTDGLTPRSDGLVWTCADVQPDGTHPSLSGRVKIASLLQDFFTQNALAAPSHVSPGGGGNAASFVLYGAGCSGSNGVPGMRNNGLPKLGNAMFRVGVEHAAPQALAGLWFSDASAQIPLAGPCALQIDPSAGLPLWPSVTAANGTRIETLAIPSVAALVGAQLFVLSVARRGRQRRAASWLSRFGGEPRSAADHRLVRCATGGCGRPHGLGDGTVLVGRAGGLPIKTGLPDTAGHPGRVAELVSEVDSYRHAFAV